MAQQVQVSGSNHTSGCDSGQRILSTTRVGIIEEKLSCDTHAYDGKLWPLYQSLVQIQDERFLSLEFLNLETVLKEIKQHSLFKNYPEAQIALGWLAQNEKNPQNIDRSNHNLNSAELLQRIWFFVRTQPSADQTVLFDVLTDIVKCGNCAQGRTTRLLWLYNCYVNPQQDCWNWPFLLKDPTATS
jgi:hypothetical protein